MRKTNSQIILRILDEFQMLYKGFESGEFKPPISLFARLWELEQSEPQNAYCEVALDLIAKNDPIIMEYIVELASNYKRYAVRHAELAKVNGEIIPDFDPKMAPLMEQLIANIATLYINQEFQAQDNQSAIVKVRPVASIQNDRSTSIGSSESVTSSSSSKKPLRKLNFDEENDDAIEIAKIDKMNEDEIEAELELPALIYEKELNQSHANEADLAISWLRAKAAARFQTLNKETSADQEGSSAKEASSTQSTSATIETNDQDKDTPELVSYKNSLFRFGKILKSIEKDQQLLESFFQTPHHKKTGLQHSRKRHKPGF